MARQEIQSLAGIFDHASGKLKLGDLKDSETGLATDCCGGAGGIFTRF
jgi:hypothetical protein